jgi:PPOX class probable F420-dependent enzyme
MVVRSGAFDARTRDFLGEPRDAFVTTINKDGSPHMTVIWYELRGDEVLINTTDDRVKYRNLERDPRVSIVIGSGAHYVRIDGTARKVATGADALRDIHDLAVRYEGAEAAERDTRNIYSKKRRVTYLVKPRRVYVKVLGE